MLSLQNHIAEIFGLITGCGLWIVWLNYLWQHGRVRRPQTEQVPLDGGGLLSHPIYPEALQDAHSSHVWITMTWKGEDWLRKVVLNFAFKLFGRKIAWAAHWVLVIERQHYCSYFELQRQRESEEPVRCLWSVLPTTDDDESPDYPLVMLGELPSRHDSERLLDAIPELDKMYVGTTSWSDAEIFGAGELLSDLYDAKRSQLT
jgi:hypothetical protein